MSNRDQLITIELARALGVDVKIPTDVVFSEQSRPEIRFLHMNVAQSGAGPSAAVRVIVPPGERWIMDLLVARGLEDSGGGGFGNNANFYLSTYDGFTVGQDSLPFRSNVPVSTRDTIAMRILKTVEFATQTEQNGFKVFIGSEGAGVGVSVSDGDGVAFARSEYTFYAGQQIFIQSDGIGAWKIGDELEIRGRYLVLPEHLLNFTEAKREQGGGVIPAKVEPGTWVESKTGVF